MPGPVAVDVDSERQARPDQPADDAARGGDEMRREIEAVAIGRGVEVERQPIATLHLRRELDQRAARANVGLSAQGSDPLTPRDRTAEAEAGNVEPGDADVEAGQDRAVRVRAAQLG